jgi:uncharacterized protein with beta-barrel porin domain
VIIHRLTDNSSQVRSASNYLAYGGLPHSPPPKTWGAGFGSHRSRGQEGLALAYEHDHYGFVGGYDFGQSRPRLGAVFGYAKSAANTNITSVNNDSDSVFGGGYGQVSLGRMNLVAVLLAGYQEHNNTRWIIDNLNGFELANSDFDGAFLSPSLTLNSDLYLDHRFVLRPSATLVYSVSWLDDYIENGATQSNLSIGDRMAHALVGRLQLALEHQIAIGWVIGLHAGGNMRYTVNDDIEGSFSGASFSYASVGDNSVYGGYLGGNLNIALKNRLSLIADWEVGKGNGDEEYALGGLRMEFDF